MTAIYDWFGYELHIKERYRLIRNAGFNGVLLWWSEYLGRDDYRRGPETAREAGLCIENIHAPFQFQDNIWHDNLAGEAATDCYLKCVKDCAEFDIPTMIVHLPDDDKPHNVLGLHRLWRIAETAEKFEVNVALENLRNLTNLSYILEKVDSLNIGLCYDACHHYRNYPDYDLLSMFGLRLMALHLHDYNRSAMHQLPFDGIIDWPMVINKISETGYSGATAIESMNWSYNHLSAEEFLNRAYEKAEILEKLRVSSQ